MSFENLLGIINMMLSLSIDVKCFFILFTQDQQDRGDM